MREEFEEEEKQPDTQHPPPKKRRRVPEACHVCRRRKAKCDGGRPCSYCKNTNQECIFDPSHPISLSLEKPNGASLTETVKALQERVKFLESKIGSLSGSLDVGSANGAWKVVPQQRTPQDNNTLFIEFGAGVSTLNSGTRNIEFYGATSSYAFAAARALFHNANTPSKITPLSPSHNSPSSSKPSPENNATKFVSIEDIGMEELLVSNDTPMPDQFDGILPSGPYDTALSINDSFLERKDIIDRHVDSFFSTVHTLLPILHEGAFRKLYGVFWKEVERKEKRRDSMDIGRDALDAGVMPLVYAVACHGALYTNADTNDQREWARTYFSKARRWLSVFETGSFETMTAMYLLAIYAQHVFKMNLAYNYLGLAIRLSYSIGLHVFNAGASDRTIATAACWPGVSKPIIGEMAKRIWWSMYASEVETSLNCGRPSISPPMEILKTVCIRNQDIYIGFPSLLDDEVVDCSDVQLSSATKPTSTSYLIEMAKFSRIVRKVLKVSYSAESTKLSFPVWTEELHNLTLELSEWREALPLHLRTSNADEFDEPFWMARQRESIQYHYNHVLLTMYREFLNVKKPFSNHKISSETGVQRCVDAARGNIVLIRDCLMAYPALRHWTHLYYYMLAASLVFIDRLNQAPFDQRALDYTRCCGLATEAFEWLRPLGGTDKIVAIIKNCLDEWNRRRDAKRSASSSASGVTSGGKVSELGLASALESDSEESDVDIGRTQESRQPTVENFGTGLPASVSSPVQAVFAPRKPAATENFFNHAPATYVHYHQAEISNSNSPFTNPQFLPDIYLASNGLSFNPGNTITLVNEPFSFLNPDVTSNAHQPTAAGSQPKLRRDDNGRAQPSVRQEDEVDHVAAGGYTYNPSERIEKMFGIDPPW